MPAKVFIAELEVGEFVQSIFLATSVEVRHTRDGEPYLAIQLRDRSGEFDARAWTDVEMLSSRIEPDHYVAVRGEVLEFAGRPYLSVQDIDVIDERDVDESDFFEHSRWNAEELLEQLIELITHEVRSEVIREFLQTMLADEALIEWLERAPAAKRNHHAFRGGLLEHCLSMCRLSLVICRHYDAYYPGMANSDLVVAGCVLHDIGKCVELDFSRDTHYSTQGRLIGHIATGASWVDRYADRSTTEIPESLRTQLKHLVLSHHGKLEFGSPVTPRTVEAQILHQVDMIDSRMNMCWNLVQQTDVEGDEGWTEYARSLEGSLHVRGATSWEVNERYDQQDLIGPGLARENAEPVAHDTPAAQNLDLFGE